MPAPIYLDNAATTYPKPDSVYEAVDAFMRTIGVSVGRGAYKRAIVADDMVYETRKLLAQLIGVSYPERIVFTPNVTVALNIAIKGIGRAGGQIITTSIEHNSVWRPLCALAQVGATITTINGDRSGNVRADHIISATDPDTDLVVLNHGSNVTGAVTDVAMVAAHCRKLGIPLIIDAAQTAGSIDIASLDIDECIIALTGHKGLYGPAGTGALYVPKTVEVQPLLHGGTGEESRSEDMPATLPDRLEAGTLNTAGICGLNAGLKYVVANHPADIGAHKRELTKLCADELSSISGVRVFYSDCDDSVGVCSFLIKDQLPGVTAARLDRDYNIMVRSGLHCSPLTHRTIGTDTYGTVRVSPGAFTTTSDIKRLLDAVADIGRGE